MPCLPTTFRTILKMEYSGVDYGHYLLPWVDPGDSDVPPERIACGIGAMQVELAPHYSHDI